MRTWTATADVRERAALPTRRDGGQITVLPARLAVAPAPYAIAKTRATSWPRALGLTLGVWSASYLARQALTWGSADMPFSPLGSFALEGIALAVVAIGAVLAWSVVALAALRHSEHAPAAAPAQSAVIAPDTVPVRAAASARPAPRGCRPAPLPAPVRTNHPAWSPVRRSTSRHNHRAAA